MIAGGRAIDPPTPTVAAPVRPRGRGGQGALVHHSGSAPAAVRIRRAMDTSTPRMEAPSGPGGQERIDAHSKPAAGPTPTHPAPWAMKYATPRDLPPTGPHPPEGRPTAPRYPKAHRRPSTQSQPQEHDPMNEHPTVLAVAEKVRDAMNANGGNRKKAVQKIADDLAPARPSAIRKLWADGFGYYAVSEAAGDVQRRAPAYMSDDPPPPDHDLPDNWGTNWRDGIDPMEVPVPIGNTGRSKAWGELTREDLTTIAAFRDASGKTLVRQAQTLKTMAMKVAEDQTLRDALPALDTDERAVIEEITKVTFTDDSKGQAA